MDFEVVHVLATGTDDASGVAVGGLGHIHAVPVDNRIFCELVREVDAHPLSAAQVDDWPEVRAGEYLQRLCWPLDHPASEAPHARGRTRKHRDFVRRSRQLQFEVWHEPGGWYGLLCRCNSESLGERVGACRRSRDGGKAQDAKQIATVHGFLQKTGLALFTRGRRPCEESSSSDTTA